jgi:chemosensory pili system protein ChpC
VNTANPQRQSEGAAPEAVSVHTLLISMEYGSLMVPSVMVAEVLPVQVIFDVDNPRRWVLGRIHWRGLSIPVISFERLVCDLRPTRDSYSRVVVFYPLPGHRHDDYFGVLTTADPRSMLVGEELVTCALPDTVTGRYISSAVEVRGQVATIPDVDALATAIY